MELSHLFTQVLIISSLMCKHDLARQFHYSVHIGSFHHRRNQAGPELSRNWTVGWCNASGPAPATTAPASRKLRAS